MPKRAPDFSQHTVAQAKPRTKPYELRDGRGHGLILRVQPSGTKLWYCALKTGRRFAIGDADAITLKYARQEAEQIRQLGHRPAQAQPSKGPKRVPTLRQFLGDHKKGKGRPEAPADDDTLTYRAHFKATHNRAQQQLNNLNLFDEFSATPVDQLTRALLDKWIVKRLNAGASKATIKRNVGALKAALNKAVEWEVIPASPLATYKPLTLRGADHARTRFLTPEEDKRLHKALKDVDVQFRTLVLLALYTGARQGQLLKLEWRDIDMKHKRLTLRPETAKTNKVNIIPLNAKAMKAITELREEQGALSPTDAIFPGNKGKHWVNVNGLWNELKDEAKLEEFTFHDLRHTFASNLVQRGVDLYTVQQLLGHSDPKLTSRYAHLAPNLLVQAVEKL